jgi:hypothetical protein
MARRASRPCAGMTHRFPSSLDGSCHPRNEWPVLVPEELFDLREVVEIVSRVKPETGVRVAHSDL